MNTPDGLVFSDEGSHVPAAAPWRILIADDEEDVHRVTKLALAEFMFDERPLQFIDVYSGRDAVTAMRDNPDIAIALVDVVMEHDAAGLEAIDAIRTTLRNRDVRIVLRTGQAGQAPEREVVTRYDINDYKEKTELTATKLFTLIYTSLTQYRDLRELEAGRVGLQRVLGASASIFEQRLPQTLARSVLQELAVLFDLDLAPHHATDGGLAIDSFEDLEPLIICGTGRFAGCEGTTPLAALGPQLAARLQKPPTVGLWHQEAGEFIAFLPAGAGARTVFYACGTAPLRPPARQLLDLFCANVVIALENTRLNQEVHRTQSELVFMLSEAIEKRSNETGFHVRRVAEYSRLLGLLQGMDEAEAELLRIASPLHDAGKIAIPDAVLNKPGRHTPEEAAIMATHADLGRQIFQTQTLPVLRAAAIVAGQHHERWDGLGYPNRLAGSEIHIYGRITALADVFDALGSRRCYKHPWPLEEIFDLIRSERGRQFDPYLVDLFFANIEKFLEIRNKLADETEAATGH